MKTLLKLTCAIFAFTLLFTACSKDDDDSAPRVAKEITAEELENYIKDTSILNDYSLLEPEQKQIVRELIKNLTQNN